MGLLEMSNEPAGAALGGRSPVLPGAFAAHRAGIFSKARRMFEERSKIRGEVGREWERDFDEPELGAE